MPIDSFSVSPSSSALWSSDSDKQRFQCIQDQRMNRFLFQDNRSIDGALLLLIPLLSGLSKGSSVSFHFDFIASEFYDSSINNRLRLLLLPLTGSHLLWKQQPRNNGQTNGWLRTSSNRREDLQDDCYANFIRRSLCPSLAIRSFL